MRSPVLAVRAGGGVTGEGVAVQVGRRRSARPRPTPTGTQPPPAPPAEDQGTEVVRVPPRATQRTEDAGTPRAGTVPGRPTPGLGLPSEKWGLGGDTGTDWTRETRGEGSLIRLGDDPPRETARQGPEAPPRDGGPVAVGHTSVRLPVTPPARSRPTPRRTAGVVVTSDRVPNSEVPDSRLKEVPPRPPTTSPSSPTHGVRDQVSGLVHSDPVSCRRQGVVETQRPGV